MLVIKIGGGAGIDADAYARFAADFATLREPAVLIHGGNAEFSRLSGALGMPPRMITNDKGRVTRYTDRETMDVMLMAYCGKVNKTLVGALQTAGVNAVGLSGLDGAIATGRRKPVLRGLEDGKPKVLRDDHAGTIQQVDTRLVRLLMEHGYLPVLTPPALSEGGVPINVDGDKLALGLAIDLHADGLLFFSDTPGLLANKDDESTLIHAIDATSREAALTAAAGRMKVKVEAALDAIERGVGRVIFADARADQPISRALGGEGTVVRAAATAAAEQEQTGPAPDAGDDASLGHVEAGMGAIEADETAQAVGQYLLILCGLPFAGKSTLARAVAQRLGLVHVELDRAHEQQGIDLDAGHPAPADWVRAYRAAYKRLDQVLGDGASAVFDATNFRRVDRDRARRIAAAHAVPGIVVHLAISPVEARRRLDQNRRTRERWNVPDEDFSRVADGFEAPRSPEEVVRYDGTIPLDAWIEGVLIPALKERAR